MCSVSHTAPLGVRLVAVALSCCHEPMGDRHWELSEAVRPISVGFLEETGPKK